MKQHLKLDQYVTNQPNFRTKTLYLAQVAWIMNPRALYPVTLSRIKKN